MRTPGFLQRRFRLRITVTVLLFVLGLVLAHPVFAQGAAGLPPDFTQTIVANGLNSVTSMTIAPDGRIFVAEQGGAVRVIRNDVLLPAPAITLNGLNTEGERGLLGITTDPNFLNNGYIYLYHTVNQPTIHHRISRFTLNGDTVVGGSEQIILELETLPNIGAAWSYIHNGGAIHFGPDGKLYIAVGDYRVPASAPLMNNLQGKILRINADGSIPNDNPYYNALPGRYRMIWARGLRSPHTFDIQPGTGRLFVNDVGQDTWEEINEGVPGADYGWPTYEGATNVPGYNSPLYTYNHGWPDPDGGCAVTGGAFYNPAVQRFPNIYVGDYFFADYCRESIRTYDPNTGQVTPFASFIAPATVDLKTSPNGALYYLARGAFGTTSLGQVYRIDYGQNLPPAIAANPADLTVTEGTPASFTCTGSSTTPLTYRWERDGVVIPNTNADTYTVNVTTLADSGARFNCVAINVFGETPSAEATLTVEPSQPPVAIINDPAAPDFRAGDVITFTGEGIDLEDGNLPPAALTWWVDLVHADHTHPVVQQTTGQANGTFSIPTLLHAPDAFYRIHMRVVDSVGLTDETTRDIQPVTVNLEVRANSPGLIVLVDGSPFVSPYNLLTLSGAQHEISAPVTQTLYGTLWTLQAWNDQNITFPRTVVMTDTDATYTALFAPDDPDVVIPPQPQQAVLSVGTVPITEQGFAPTLSMTASGSAGVFGIVGGTVEWLVTLSNIGSDPGSSLVLDVAFPPGLRIDSTNSPFGSASISGQNMRFTLPQLAPGTQMQFRIIATIQGSPVGSIIRASAVLNGTHMANAQLRVVSTLPQTGLYARPDHLLPIVLAMVFGGLAGFILSRYRKTQG